MDVGREARMIPYKEHMSLMIMKLLNLVAIASICNAFYEVFWDALELAR